MNKFITLFVACLLSIMSFAQDSPFNHLYPKLDIVIDEVGSDKKIFCKNIGEGSDLMMIYDDFGTPLYGKYAKTYAGLYYFEGTNQIAHFEQGIAGRYFLFLNDKFEVTDTVFTELELGWDEHDIQILPDGTKFLYGFQLVQEDISSVTGVEGDTARTIKHHLIQKLDTDNEIIGEWSTVGNFDINDQIDSLEIPNSDVDAFHLNSIQALNDSILILTFRHLDQVCKLNFNTGEILWKLGGKENEFEFINDDIRFSMPHHAQLLPNGHLILFDNGNFHSEQVSSAVEYEIDEVNKTATLLRRIYNDGFYTGRFGSVQQLENGNLLVGWGRKNESFDAAQAIEYNSQSEIVWEGRFDYDNYRVKKHNFIPKTFKLPLITEIPETDTTVCFYVTNNLSKDIEINGFHTRTDSVTLLNSLPINISMNDSVEVCVEVDFNTAIGFSDIVTLIYDTELERIASQTKVVKTPIVDIYQPLENDVLCYPNPFDKKLVFTSNTIPQKIELFDSNGKLCVSYKNIKFDEINIDTSEYNSGIYFVKAFFKNNIVVCKKVTKLK